MTIIKGHGDQHSAGGKLEIDKKLNPGIIPSTPWKVGDMLLASANTEKTTTATDYTKVKEIKVGCDGALRVKHDAKSAVTGESRSQVYKNGVAWGAEVVSTTTTYATTSEDLFGCKARDLIQLYNKKVAQNSVIRNFQIYVYKFEGAEVVTD